MKDLNSLVSDVSSNGSVDATRALKNLAQQSGVASDFKLPSDDQEQGSEKLNQQRPSTDFGTIQKLIDENAKQKNNIIKLIISTTKQPILPTDDNSNNMISQMQDNITALANIELQDINLKMQMEMAKRDQMPSLDLNHVIGKSISYNRAIGYSDGANPIKFSYNILSQPGYRRYSADVVIKDSTGRIVHRKKIEDESINDDGDNVFVWNGLLDDDKSIKKDDIEHCEQGEYTISFSNVKLLGTNQHDVDSAVVTTGSGVVNKILAGPNNTIRGVELDDGKIIESSQILTVLDGDYFNSNKPAIDPDDAGLLGQNAVFDFDKLVVKNGQGSFFCNNDKILDSSEIDGLVVNVYNDSNHYNLAKTIELKKILKEGLNSVELGGDDLEGLFDGNYFIEVGIRSKLDENANDEQQGEVTYLSNEFSGRIISVNADDPNKLKVKIEGDPYSNAIDIAYIKQLYIDDDIMGDINRRADSFIGSRVKYKDAEFNLKANDNFAHEYSSALRDGNNNTLVGSELRIYDMDNNIVFRDLKNCHLPEYFDINSLNAVDNQLSRNLNVIGDVDTKDLFDDNKRLLSGDVDITRLQFDNNLDDSYKNNFNAFKATFNYQWDGKIDNNLVSNRINQAINDKGETFRMVFYNIYSSNGDDQIYSDSIIPENSSVVSRSELDGKSIKLHLENGKVIYADDVLL